MVKDLPAVQETGDLGSIPGSGRSLGGGKGNPLQYSCQENPMDRGARWVIVHGGRLLVLQMWKECCKAK